MECNNCGKDLTDCDEFHVTNHEMAMETAHQYGYRSQLVDTIAEMIATTVTRTSDPDATYTIQTTYCQRCDYYDRPRTPNPDKHLSLAFFYAIGAASAVYTIPILIPVFIAFGASRINAFTHADRANRDEKWEARKAVEQDHQEHHDDTPSPDELREQFVAGAITEDELDEELDEAVEPVTVEEPQLETR